MYSATHPIRFTPYKITPPYFQPKNAKIIDPTFWVNKSTYIRVVAAARGHSHESGRLISIWEIDLEFHMYSPKK